MIIGNRHKSALIRGQLMKIFSIIGTLVDSKYISSPSLAINRFHACQNYYLASFIWM